jgi:hypothetical protein
VRFAQVAEMNVELAHRKAYSSEAFVLITVPGTSLEFQIVSSPEGNHKCYLQ